MRVVSLQVGPAGTLQWRGKLVRSAIDKQPVGDRPIPLLSNGFEGDEQADLRLHGGPDKAVCCYPSEHMPRWEELLGEHLPPGAFGENLLLEGLLESDANIGDTFELGSALVQLSQPRGPCFKLAARWGSRRMPNVMAAEGRSGFYLRVVRPGEVRAGDELRLAERRSDVSVADVMRVTYVDRSDVDLIVRVMEVPELAEQWRAGLRALLRRRVTPGDVTAD
jgi:MOSC domain-containing protein YiiM